MNAVVGEKADCPRRAVVLNGRVVVKVDHVVIHSRSLDAQDHQSLLEMTVLALIQGFQGTANIIKRSVRAEFASRVVDISITKSLRSIIRSEFSSCLKDCSPCRLYPSNLVPDTRVLLVSVTLRSRRVSTLASSAEADQGTKYQKH